MAPGTNRRCGLIHISLQIIIGFAIGLVLGAFNYSLLWMTVNRLMKSGSPGLITLFSFFVRMAVILLVFYILAVRAGWISVAAGLAGLILIRAVMVGKFGPGQQSYRTKGDRRV
ncbi:MAG TPA: hypothetical protein ENO22_00145 [candidate division Zixibacteria bacterium]|nr:hypothetical protein [candidate division Zixibacteria bacterium]HEQ97737.1 hypothetical protein [candidate division Zixibacteria bacterium]